MDAVWEISAVNSICMLLSPVYTCDFMCNLLLLIDVNEWISYGVQMRPLLHRSNHNCPLVRICQRRIIAHKIARANGSLANLAAAWVILTLRKGKVGCCISWIGDSVEVFGSILFAFSSSWIRLWIANVVKQIWPPRLSTFQNVLEPVLSDEESFTLQLFPSGICLLSNVKLDT